MPAKVEVASTTLKESVTSLLDGTNPCAIPEKDLTKELKRRKHYLVFSGVNVAMQFQCGNQERIIRSDILDRDLFDAHPDTPEHVTWTMHLLDRLTNGRGPDAFDEPMLGLPDGGAAPAPKPELPVLRDVVAGKYDALFPGAAEKPAQVYALAQKPIPEPTVRLLSSLPFEPISARMPAYPAIARAARFGGTFTFSANVDSNGRLTNVTPENAPRLLEKSVELAAGQWVFPTEARGQRIEATLEFSLNCNTNSQ